MGTALGARANCAAAGCLRVKHRARRPSKTRAAAVLCQNTQQCTPQGLRSTAPPLPRPSGTPQGREKDIAFFSTVRSQRGSRGIGFVADERRINVGLTRARCAAAPPRPPPGVVPPSMQGQAPACSLLRRAVAWCSGMQVVGVWWVHRAAGTALLRPPLLALPSPAWRPQGHVDSGGPCGVAADQPPLVGPGVPCPQGRLHVQSGCGPASRQDALGLRGAVGKCAAQCSAPCCIALLAHAERCAPQCSRLLALPRAAAKPFADWVTQLAEGQVQPVPPTAEDTAEWAPQVGTQRARRGAAVRRGAGWSCCVLQWTARARGQGCFFTPALVPGHPSPRRRRMRTMPTTSATTRACRPSGRNCRQRPSAAMQRRPAAAGDEAAAREPSA